MNKPLRVGFDLDGVLLYNPARIFRPVVAFVKKAIFHQRVTQKNKFHIPKANWEKKIWHAFHYSSLFVSPGVEYIEELKKAVKIEPYIISARYSFLADDFGRWMKKLNRNDTFVQTYFNKKDEQPHLYKERMIKQLGLDVFIEDNWDIVEYLAKKSSAKIFWIYNIGDFTIHYDLKFSNLKKVVKHIEKNLIKKA